MSLDEYTTFQFVEKDMENHPDPKLKQRAKAITVFVDIDNPDKFKNEMVSYLNREKVKIPDLEITQVNNCIFSFSTKEEKRAGFNKLLSALRKANNVHGVWFPPSDIEDIQQQIEDKTGFKSDYLGFVLKGKTPKSEYWENWLNMSIMVWTKNAADYEKNFKEFVKKRFGFVLRKDSIITRLVKDNPGEGRLYYDNEAHISMMHANTSEPFEKALEIEQKHIKSLCKRVEKHSSHFVSEQTDENDSPLPLSITVDDKKEAMNYLNKLVGETDISKLFLAYFSERQLNKSTFKIFPITSKSDDGDYYTSRLLNLYSGESIIFQVELDTWQMSLTPTFSTKPWTVMQAFKEINQACPFDIKAKELKD